MVDTYSLKLRPDHTHLLNVLVYGENTILYYKCCHDVHNTLLPSLAAESLSSDEEFPFSDEEEGGMDVAVDHYHYETLVSYMRDCV